MVLGLHLFAAFVAPMIALIAWGISVVRLRSWVLGGISLLLGLFILFTTPNAPLAVTRNPYVMLLFMGLVIFNVLVLPYADEQDRPYLVVADTVVLLMIAALHGWNLYLRQSDLYFYEQSTFSNLMYAFVVSFLSLILPVLAVVIRPSRHEA